MSYFDGLVQDCSNAIVNALELLQSCTKPSIWTLSCKASLMNNIHGYYKMLNDAFIQTLQHIKCYTDT